MVPPRRVYSNKFDTHHSVVHHKIDKNTCLEVSNFHEEHNPKVFLDWLHSIESFFDWHEVPEGQRLRFIEAKLKGTIRMY